MGRLSVGVVHQPIQGEQLSGDAYLVIDAGEHYLVAVVDGLGHGPEAHEAAKKALEVVQAAPGEAVERLLESCHGALRATRGVVMGLARVDRAAGQLSYAGVGNIEARLIGADKVRRPISHNGIVGYGKPRFRVERFPFVPGDVLVMHTDGVSDRFELPGRARDEEPQTLAFHLALAYGRAADDQLMVVVRETP